MTHQHLPRRHILHRQIIGPPHMPKETITQPDRHPNLPPGRNVFRRLPIRTKHERLDYPDICCTENEGSIEDGRSVRREEWVEIFPEESGGAGQDG